MRRRILTLIALMVGSVLSFAFAEPPSVGGAVSSVASVEQALLKGIFDAKTVLAARKLKVLVFGPPPGPEQEARAKVLLVYGVETGYVGDVYTAEIDAYLVGYETIMRQGIVDRHGRGFWGT